jgi:hypothetical protein
MAKNHGIKIFRPTFKHSLNHYTKFFKVFRHYSLYRAVPFIDCNLKVGFLLRSFPLIVFKRSLGIAPSIALSHL